jgi:hypothetical protein
MQWRVRPIRDGIAEAGLLSQRERRAAADHSSALAERARLGL